MTREGGPRRPGPRPRRRSAAVTTSNPSTDSVAASESRDEVVVVDDRGWSGASSAGRYPSFDFAEGQGHAIRRPGTGRRSTLPGSATGPCVDTAAGLLTGGAGDGADAVRGSGGQASGRHRLRRADSHPLRSEAEIVRTAARMRCQSLGQYEGR